MKPPKYDDLFPVSASKDDADKWWLLDRHNDRIAEFDPAREEEEIVRIVERLNFGKPRSPLADAVVEKAKERRRPTVVKKSLTTRKPDAAARAARRFREAVINDQELAEMWARHHLTDDPAEEGACAWCDGLWPCDASRLLTEVADLKKRLAKERKDAMRYRKLHCGCSIYETCTHCRAEEL